MCIDISVLKEKLSLKCISEVPMSKCTGVYSGDLLSRVMCKAKRGDIWITVMSNINVIAVAYLVGISCIILTEGVELTVDDAVIAKNKGVCVYSTNYSTYESCKIISQICDEEV